MTRQRSAVRLLLAGVFGALSLLVAACAGPEPAAEPPATEGLPETADGPATSPSPAEPETAEQDPVPAPSPPAREAEASPGPEVGAAVPEVLDFSVPALGGGQVVGAELAGDALALWFWAPW